MANPGYQALRDGVLQARIDDLLSHDQRLRGLTVDVRVNGGVAHVDGWVPQPEDRSRLREAVTALRGVHAFWDGLRVGDQASLRLLDIGAGGAKQKVAAVGLDLLPGPGVDLVADLRRGLPLRDASVDRVYAVHVLEHLIDVVALLDELHRVLARDGVLHVMTPHWQAPNAVADPTHVRFFDVQTFKWFCTPRPGALPWYPLTVSCDGASVLADLAPVHRHEDLADDARLALFFD